jgi:UDP:flavonoid glycosyltransferase YjiC (YdhE family)
VTKKLDDLQRRELGLPKAKRPPPQRIIERGTLQIQAYDEVWFPEQAAEWAKLDGRRPFIGTPTMALSTDADDEVASWIGAGTPPIFFGFGSIAVEGGADALAMISAACAQLGERALVCSAATELTHAAHREHVKVVSAVNYAAVFPACRAVVHHGGLGTLAAGMRAGVPTLMLWTYGDSARFGHRLQQLKVGAARSFSTTTLESLVADLRTILAPEYAVRAREIASQIIKPDEAVMTAANLLENFARLKGHAFTVPPKHESERASDAPRRHAD